MNHIPDHRTFHQQNLKNCLQEGNNPTQMKSLYREFAPSDNMSIRDDLYMHQDNKEQAEDSAGLIMLIKTNEMKFFFHIFFIDKQNFPIKI